MGYSLNKNIILNVQDIAKKYPIKKIVLFGSRARADNKPSSDIDLAVFTLPEFINKGIFSSEIDDLNTLLKIDIVFVNDKTDPKLLNNINKDGVIIYERL